MEIPEFDPLGLSKGKDEATIGYYRAAELKHGRVCMLASVGYLVQGLYHLPDGPFEASKPLDALIKVRSINPPPPYPCPAAPSNRLVLMY